MAADGALAVLTWFLAIHVFHIVRIPLTRTIDLWLAVTLAGVCLAIVNLRRSRWWRKVIAATSIVIFFVTGALAINASLGMNHTLGSLVGVVVRRPVALVPLAPTTPGVRRGPLWKEWKPPAEMPAQGTVGTAVIPGTISGFVARPAGIYLPPAALIKNPPALPLVVMMMGQPGTPDPQYAATILDRFAAEHHGLAPIVVVADQLGDPTIDTLCLDTAQFGNVETYLTQDVVNWATANLNVTHDHRYWTVAGYSNGGQCAISLAVKHPELWSNVLDISGEEYPGSDAPQGVLQDVFNGDQAAYNTQMPVNLLAKTQLPGTFGVFTVGSNDSAYIPGVRGPWPRRKQRV